METADSAVSGFAQKLAGLARCVLSYDRNATPISSSQCFVHWSATVIGCSTHLRPFATAISTKQSLDGTRRQACVGAQTTCMLCTRLAPTPAGCASCRCWAVPRMRTSVLLLNTAHQPTIRSSHAAAQSSSPWCRENPIWVRSTPYLRFKEYPTCFTGSNHSPRRS